MLGHKITKITLLTIFSVFCISSLIPCSEAHILIIGDSKSDYPTALQETQTLASELKSKGYNVLELYQNEANTKNILKGMYDADAIIYAGHGGYQSGNYNSGGVAKEPFALVGSNDFIWGIGSQMREGWNGELFYAPIKSNIPVILLHACFTTGWVENNEVSNPIETIYNFSNMFTSAGANYYATAWNGAEIVHDFLNGAFNFQAANQNNYEIITKETVYNGVPIWRNDHGYASFVGDWSGQFPTVSQTTPYDDANAEIWYNGKRVRNVVKSSFSIPNGPFYTNQPITFTENSYADGNNIISYLWDFGDGIQYQSNTPVNPSHTFQQANTYQVTHTVTDTQNNNATSNRTISISDPPTTVVNTQTTTTVNTPPLPTVNTPIKTTYVYKWVKKGKKWYRIKVKLTKKVTIRKKVKRKKIIRKRR